MVAVLENKGDAIAALCRRYGVVRLEVFGSVLRDDFRPGESIDEAFQRADMALYGAKAAGRNRVMISPDSFESSDGGTTIRAF